MARHHDIAVHFAQGVFFFAPPATPWLRGTNESTNGLLRQYFPKDTNLRMHTAEELKAVEARLNDRPRKILGWRTALQVFTAMAG
jgi:transposase, IS30 family